MTPCGAQVCFSCEAELHELYHSDTQDEGDLSLLHELLESEVPLP